ncbi:MAG: E3 binding domain-containing protein [Thermoleophilia bacterium]
MSTASRRARQLADELGLALETVSGTGPGGRITLGDVESAALGRVGSSVERAAIHPAEPGDRAPLPVPPAPPSRPTAPAPGIAPRFSVTARRTISVGRLLERRRGAGTLDEQATDLGPILLHAAAVALDRAPVALALGTLNDGAIGLHVVDIVAGTPVDEIAAHVARMASDAGSPEGIVIDAGILGVDEIEVACDAAWVCCAGRVVSDGPAPGDTRMTLTVTANPADSRSGVFDAARLLGRIADVLEGSGG